MLIPQAPTVADLAEGFIPIKEATYNLRVNKAEYVPKPKGLNTKGNPYLSISFVVTGAPGQPDVAETGRLVFMNYPLAGDGSFRLRELLEATGHQPDFQLQDTEQLHALEFTAAVIIEKGKENYPDKNQIRKHLPLANEVVTA